jgi:hypothetical protein
MDPSIEVVHVPRGGDVVRAEDFLPLMTVEQAVQRKQQINEFISSVMVDGEDYGKMPATAKKVLLKPGAEKLCSIFGLAPRYIIESEAEDWIGDLHAGEPFFNYRYRCQLYRGDRFMGEAIGSCNSWESKYRYRQTARACPTCAGEFIIQGKAEYGGGWLCFKKKGGCGAKFAQDDERITSQQIGKVVNPDVADLVNTLQKMAQKRALVAAVLVVTNCSDAFTQDLEDSADARLDNSPEFHQRNSPEQQSALAQKRIAEEKEKSANVTPAELRQFFDAIDKDIADAAHVFDYMFLLLSNCGADGAKAYDRIADAFNVSWPKGCTDKGPLKVCIRELYQAYEKVKANKPTAAAGTEPVEPSVLFADDPAFDTVGTKKGSK